MTNAEIQAFLMVAEEKNITSAADKLFISQSSLSIRIKTLEKEVGCKLFDRNRGKHEIKLTKEGEHFLDLALKYQKILKQMSEIGQNQEYYVRIGSVNSINSYLLSDVCDLFMIENPDARLEVHDFEKTSDLCTWVEKGQLDFAITVGDSYNRKVRSKPLFLEKMVFICNKNSDYPEKINLSDLRMNYEIYVNWFTEFIKWHDHLFLDAQKPAVFVSNMAQLSHFLKQKEKWAFVPASVARDLTEHFPWIAQRGIAFAIPQRKAMLMMPEDKPLSSFQNEFLDLLCDYTKTSYYESITLFD